MKLAWLYRLGVIIVSVTAITSVFSSAYAADCPRIRVADCDKVKQIGRCRNAYQGRWIRARQCRWGFNGLTQKWSCMAHTPCELDFIELKK